MSVDLSAIVLPDRHPPQEFVDDVVLAEQAGVRTAWTYDHLLWTYLPDSPWHGCVPLLAAAAARTDRVRLGTQVATPNYRHPVPFAKDLVTLDHLMSGRLDLGVGAGADGPDAVVLGRPELTARDRTARFAEWLGLLDRVLREPRTSSQGEWFTAVDARQLPRCRQAPRVPFTVAATGPRGFALTARLGQGWVTNGVRARTLVTAADGWFDELARQSAQLGDAMAEAGREPGSVRRIAQLKLDTRWPFESSARYADTLGRLDELGFDELCVHWGRPDGRGIPSEALDMVAAAHAA
jgi:alkanesulfonate monooxygenase SsuD/methylene tetrahydromethanopterin reductase-like flavin-dependent oxidoreductase (luciferase family)